VISRGGGRGERELTVWRHAKSARHTTPRARGTAAIIQVSSLAFSKRGGRERTRLGTDEEKLSTASHRARGELAVICGRKCSMAVQALASWGAGTLTRPGKRDSWTSRCGLRKQGELHIPTVPAVTRRNHTRWGGVETLRQRGALAVLPLVLARRAIPWRM
jgi:hypothetical protein